jgi:hypothetical protein
MADASPFILDKTRLLFLIYVGDNLCFHKTTNKHWRPSVSAMIPYVPMVTQYFYPWSDRFDEVIDFMKSNMVKYFLKLVNSKVG